MAEYPLVSIITINYIQIKDTVEFLESAQKITYPNVEIIVIDNNSPAGKPTEEIKKRFPKVKFIQSDTNLGFAGGNNVGIKIAKGEYYFLINNDTILFPGFLEPIVDFMQQHPDAGMASPKVLYPDEITIQFAGGTKISTLTGRGKCFGLMEKDTGQYDVNYKTELVHGGALIIPRKVVDKIGLMPELYFLYYEELDWCEIVKRMGYSIYYIGKSKIIHKESVSTGTESPLKIYYLTRNRLLFMRRNSTPIQLSIGLLFFSLISIPKNTIQFLLKGKMRLIKPFYKGVFWNLVNYKIN